MTQEEGCVGETSGLTTPGKTFSNSFDAASCASSNLRELQLSPVPTISIASTDDNSTRDATLISNSSSASGSRVVRINREYDKSSDGSGGASSGSDDEPSVYLCCSRVYPDQFQIDLCPRKWFCCCSTEEESIRGTKPGVIDVLWKACFVLFCLPLCYPCFLTR
jgi:hypothetical protein